MNKQRNTGKSISNINNTTQVAVLIQIEILTYCILQQLIKQWPQNWTYVICPKHIDTFNATDRNSNVRVVDFDESRVLLKTLPVDCWILLNDDSALSIPAEEQIQYILKNNGIGIVAPTWKDDITNPLYSPDRSTTPDHYLNAIVIPRNLMKFFGKLLSKSMDRWSGHFASLICIENHISYTLLQYYKFVFPSIDLIKGRHIIKNRKYSVNVLKSCESLSDSYFSSEIWSIRNNKAIESIERLPEHTTTAEIDLDFKREIDKHLSEITAYLLKKSDNDFRCPYLNNNIVELKGKKVAIFKIDSIGDVIVSTPIIESIKNSGANEVALVTTKAIESIYQTDKKITKIISFEERRKIAIAEKNSVKLLESDFLHVKDKLSGYDVAVFPRYYPDFSLGHQLAIMLDIPIRVGIVNKIAKEGQYYNPLYECMLTHCTMPHHEQHEVEKINSLAHIFNFTSLQHELNIPLQEEENGLKQYGLTKKNYIAIGIGAMSINRRWPSENINQAIDLIAAQHKTNKFKFVIIGGKDVEELSSGITSSKNVINLVGKLSLQETSHLIQTSLAYLGNDSGTMHIAAALHIPIVEISMHPQSAPEWHINSPKRFGPWGTEKIILQPETPLDNDCSQGCIKEEAHCILQITPMDVASAVINVINGHEV